MAFGRLALRSNFNQTPTILWKKQAFALSDQN
jgi:hypothetical protein